MATPRRGKRELLWAAAALVVVVAMYWDVGGIFLSRWFESSTYYHCAAVPVLAGWFLWRRWEAIRDANVRPSIAGFALLIFGLLLYWAYARTGARLVAGVAFPVILGGIVGAAYGTRMLHLTAAPIGLLIFAIPFPEHALGMIAMPMQVASAAIAGKVAPIIGLPVMQQGIHLNLRGFDFVVAQECSGMHSLVALMLTGLVLVELSGLEPVRRGLAIVAIAPLVLLANVVRLVVVLLLAEYLGADFALGTVVHGFSDIIVYFAAVLAFVLLIGWLYEQQEVEAAQVATGAPVSMSHVEEALRRLAEEDASSPSSAEEEE